MEALRERGISEDVFLWSDDNLSNKYFSNYLSKKEREYMANYPRYSRVGCFKGYDSESFAFNTLASPELFIMQFELFRGFIELGFDMYAYVTFTSPIHQGLRNSMAEFVDKLQAVHPNLPLRTVPLKIRAFTPTKSRLTPKHDEAIIFQQEVHSAWLEQLHQRFSKNELSLQITDVSMKL